MSIYAAVIRQLVATDGPSGGNPASVVVYVIDGAVEGAEDPMRTVDTLKPEEPFDPAVKEGLTRALADLPTLIFVEDRSSVVTGERPGHVINGGILLMLGPIRGMQTKVEVGNNRWLNGLAGQWFTYVVGSSGGAWSITGTDGAVAIS